MTISLAAFFANQYNNCAADLLDDALADISNAVAHFPVDIKTAIDRLANDVRLGEERKLSDSNQCRFVTDKKGYGSAAVWLKHCRSDAGIECHAVTVKYKGDSVRITTYDTLLSEFERFKALNGNKTAKARYDQVRQQRIAAQQQREAIRAKAQAAAAEKARQEKQRAQQIKAEYLAAYDAASSLDTSEPYLQRKRITGISLLPAVRSIAEYFDNQLKEWRPVPPNSPPLNKQRTITVVPLARIGSQPAGLQRISEGGKFQTRAVESGDYQGAFFVLGPKLTNGKPIDVCEGFATSATSWLATENSTIFAISADNAKALIPQLLQLYPDSKIRLISDNDMAKAKQGKGNKGQLIALELLQEFGHKKALRVFIPRVSKLPSAGTDINDIHCLHPDGLAEVRRQLKDNSQWIKATRFDDRFQLALARFRALSHHAQTSNLQLNKTIFTGLALCPAKYQPADVISQVIGAARQSGHNLNAKLVNTLVTKATARAQWGAQQSRAFSRQKISQPNIAYRFFNTSVITPEVLAYIDSIANGLVLVRAPMGSGKTQGLIKPMIDQPGKGAYIAHRVSLIAGATAALNKRVDQNGNVTKLDETLSVKHYQLDLTPESAPSVEKLACCVNSVINPLPSAICQNLDQLFIDEASQTLDAITIGGAMHAPQAVFGKLLAMMRNSRRVVLCDADANDNLITLAELASKERDQQVIHVIELKTDCSNITVQHTDHASLVTVINQSAAAGERMIIATDNCAEAEAMHQELIDATAKHGGKGILITGGNSGDKELDDFFAHLNHYVNPTTGQLVEKPADGIPWLQHQGIQWVIYSPAITSGVSIEVPHFNRHFGRFSGISISPSEAIQMLRRDRTSTQFIVGLKTSSSNEETDANRIISAYYQAALERDDLQFTITDDFQTVVKTADHNFDRMRALTLANAAAAKSNFANNLLWCLTADGYRVSPMQTTDLMIEAGKAMIEASQDAAKEALINRVMGVDTPSAERLASLDSKRMIAGLSATEQAEIVRHEITHLMQQPVTPESIVWHKNGALRKIRRFELLCQPESALADFDNGQQLAGIAASRLEHAKAKQAALLQFFQLLGIDASTGAGETNTAAIRAAFNHFMDDKRRDKHNAVLRIGAQVKQAAIVKMDPTKWVQGAFERLGVNLKRHERKRFNDGQMWTYRIESSSWAMMQGVAKRRAENNVSAWKMSETGPVNKGQTDTGRAKAQPAVNLKHPSPVMHTVKSKAKQAVKAISDFLNIPAEYVISQMDRADYRDLQGGLMNISDLGGRIRQLWEFDGPLFRARRPKTA